MTLLTDNLLAYYSMEGNSNDELGTYNGTDTNMTYGAEYGKVSQGSYNSTTNQQEGITTSLSAAIKSVSFWIKGLDSISTATPNGNEWGLVIGQFTSDSNGFKFRRYSSSNNLGFKIGGTDYYWDNNATNLLMDTTWHHIVVTTDGTNTYEYTDGALTYTISGVTWTTTGNVSMHCSVIDTSKRHFGGSLDEVGIRNRTLTPSEISALYNGGNGLAYPFTATNTTNFFQFM